MNKESYTQRWVRARRAARFTEESRAIIAAGDAKKIKEQLGYAEIFQNNHPDMPTYGTAARELQEALKRFQLPAVAAGPVPSTTHRKSKRCPVCGWLHDPKLTFVRSGRNRQYIFPDYTLQNRILRAIHQGMEQDRGGMVTKGSEFQALTNYSGHIHEAFRWRRDDAYRAMIHTQACFARIRRPEEAQPKPAPANPEKTPKTPRKSAKRRRN